MAERGVFGFAAVAWRAYERMLRGLVHALAILSGATVFAMMTVTCIDVILRAFGRPLTGAFDLVSIGGVLTIGCALPYTTAVKGHVAIEYFFHKLPRRGRVFVDTVCRLVVMALFGLLAWKNVIYGVSLRDAGQVTQTLQMPIFWIPWLLAFCCLITLLVVLHNLLHPGKEMIKP